MARELTHARCTEPELDCGHTIYTPAPSTTRGPPNHARPTGRPGARAQHGTRHARRHNGTTRHGTKTCACKRERKQGQEKMWLYTPGVSPLVVASGAGQAHARQAWRVTHRQAGRQAKQQTPHPQTRAVLPGACDCAMHTKNGRAKIWVQICGQSQAPVIRGTCDMGTTRRLAWPLIPGS